MCSLYAVDDSDNLLADHVKIEGSCVETSDLLAMEVLEYRYLYQSQNDDHVAAGVHARLVATVLLSRSSPEALGPPDLRALWRGTYLVQAGETLSGISHRLVGRASLWTQIANANMTTVGDDALIYPEDRLVIPRQMLTSYVRSHYLTLPYRGRANTLRDISTELGFTRDSSINALSLLNTGFVDTIDEEFERNSMIWLPAGVSEWQEVNIGNQKPREISNRLYNTERYSPLVATLCAHVIGTHRQTCLLPVITVLESARLNEIGPHSM